MERRGVGVLSYGISVSIAGKREVGIVVFCVIKWTRVNLLNVM